MLTQTHIHSDSGNESDNEEMDHATKTDMLEISQLDEEIQRLKEIKREKQRLLMENIRLQEAKSEKERKKKEKKRKSLKRLKDEEDEKERKIRKRVHEEEALEMRDEERRRKEPKGGEIIVMSRKDPVAVDERVSEFKGTQENKESLDNNYVEREQRDKDPGERDRKSFASPQKGISSPSLPKEFVSPGPVARRKIFSSLTTSSKEKELSNNKDKHDSSLSEEREKKSAEGGFANINSWLNKRISEMRERRKRSTTLPALFFAHTLNDDSTAAAHASSEAEKEREKNENTTSTLADANVSCNRQNSAQ